MCSACRSTTLQSSCAGVALSQTCITGLNRAALLACHGTVSVYMRLAVRRRDLPLARRVGRTRMAELATRDGWAILQPTGTDASLELLGDWCRRRRASLHAALFSESALLLRGWDQTPQ